MDLLEKLAGIETRYEELNNLMSDPAVIADYTRLREVGQERTGPAADRRSVSRLPRGAAPARRSPRARRPVGNRCRIMTAMAQEEVAQLRRADRQDGEPTSRSCSCPKIRATTGTSSSRFAPARAATKPASLPPISIRMYSRFAETHNWKTRIAVQQ